MTRTLLTCAAGIALAALPGCVKAPEAPLGQPVVQQGVSVTVTGAELRILDLEGPQGAEQTASPLLVVSLHAENGGASPVRYDLNWGATASTQAQTALLFVDPGAEAAPTTGTPVPGALLQGFRYLGDPVAAPVTLAPGESLDDVLLFQRPPAGATSLVLSLPPSIFGAAAKSPAYVRVPFNDPGDVAPPAASALGEAIALDGVTLTVTDAGVTWLRLTDAAGKSGYASAPVLKIAFTATNTGSATTEYVGASSPTAPISLLRADGTAVPRATFPGGITVDGQLATATQIGAGESIQNFFLFERPAADVTQLQLIVPGRRFGRTGLARVTVPYTFADPAAPEELTTPRVIEAPAGQ